jgi:hypothetical protein
MRHLLNVVSVLFSLAVSGLILVALAVFAAGHYLTEPRWK